MSKPGKRTFAQIFLDHTGKVSDKWSLYLSEYSHILEEFRDWPVRLLEIGIQNGGSLEIWPEYFQNGLKFVGCDIDPACETLRFDDPRIAMVVGDANTDATQEKILTFSPEFEIVIDDGSHKSSDNIKSFLRYFPKVVDGGLYVVEDLHTSYWEEYEGGLFDPFSSVSFFKRLVDFVNAEHWGIERDPAEILDGFQEKYGIFITTDFLEHIHSIEFVNSLCVLRKSLPPENKLGTRHIAGSTAGVSPIVKTAKGNSLESPLQTFNPWSNRLHPPDEDLIEREKEIEKLSAELAEKEQNLRSLRKELSDIYNSKTFQIAQLLRRVRMALLPPGSWRTRTVKKVGNFGLSLINFRKTRQINRDLALIRSSAKFDSVWYLSQYVDVAVSGMDPARHYLLFGGFEGRDPSPDFSSGWYLDSHPDLPKQKINPLVHYLRSGGKDERMQLVKGEARTVATEVKSTDAEYSRIRTFNVVPYYLDASAPVEANKSYSRSKIAVHFHMFYQDMLAECVEYLKNIPGRYDLYVSTAEENDQEMITRFLQTHLSQMNAIVVKKVPNRGRDLAPLIVDFGKDLLQYDLIGHFHTKKSPHLSLLEDWFSDIMKTLLGSPAEVGQIFKLLAKDAKFVYPAPNEKILIDESGWGENYTIGKKILPNLLNDPIDEYPFIEFPQGTMFWATSQALTRFLGLSLDYADFPAEPLPTDGTIAHVLERLILISAQQVPGRNYRLYLVKNAVKEPFYEPQLDYSQARIHDTVKVLSYYLPQFYPIPENDKWHGEGFTEWNNVCKANPLFYGHYQQRSPHKDLGYYLLDSPDMLKKQAELMKLSSVDGQIFYHYWFNGRLILEKPAQMLLADTTIEMPFCFCWANENWTKKWDGNENEILLAQKYSEQDAVAFINYLIPFFKDSRHIKVDDRPVIFVYRPSSIPDFGVYKAAWQRVCAEKGIKAPYIVGVLTRGAKSPKDFGMDAGCERVLHDWTNGNVMEQKNRLYPYWPINGSILDYDEVADYYMGLPSKKDFTYFRSLIPSWDNSPRYASEAFLVNRSSPMKFQEWLETLIVDAEKRLPENQRFVVINAWNEWAESAILEPDNRFGYAYLNSIGRALAGIKFDDKEYLTHPIPATLQVSLSFGEDLLKQLRQDEPSRRKMLAGLAHSTIFSKCRVVFEQEEMAGWMSGLPDLPTIKAEPKKASSDYMLVILGLCYFVPEAIEMMVKMALHYDAGVITPTHRNDKNFTHQNITRRWEVNQPSPYMLLLKNDAKRSLKCCTEACIYISGAPMDRNVPRERVSTIVRYSRSGDMKLLQSALYSLVAQVGCKVQPILAVQDLTEEMLADLQAILKAIPWEDGCYPIIRKYTSTAKNRDLRSLMLNDSLKSVQTGYVTFLDYDDIVYPDAYAWMVERLEKTGKNATFGLLYNVKFNLTEKRINGRWLVYDRGSNYVNFLNQNPTPIHGFMLDLSKIDTDKIEYFEDMKYQEDYYLTLQIFDENDTDWESLRSRRFIGDYYHYEDKAHTLAIIDGRERMSLLSVPEYKKCQSRINDLILKIRREARVR